MKNYQKQIGDGKSPNKYWVFQYDQKFYTNKDGVVEVIKEDNTGDSHLLGEFTSYSQALECVNYKAYLPNVVIEDRISGQLLEQMCIVCPCCGKEEYLTHEDIGFTKKRLGEKFI